MKKNIPLKVIEDTKSNTSLYVSESKIYPRDVAGIYSRLRTAAGWWLLGMFYLFPWLRWDGRQAVLFDLPARKFYIFGLTFLPQDFLFLTILLIIAALSLFFFTALAGRLWCGYACPQTVWTEVFLWMERVCEGDRAQRIKLDASPWNQQKIIRKGSKHTLWVIFALWTGFTFVGFFTPILDLGSRLIPFAWGGWETFWVFFYALATWGFAGFMREQVCKYMCPYARFQSAMFDRNSLIIAYDPMRGEPRGPRKRDVVSVLKRARGLLDKNTAHQHVVTANLNPSAASQRVNATGTIDLLAGHYQNPLDFEADNTEQRHSPDALGDCIDCTICVQVCPTGIDIRNGLQYECIACGACIDACNDVMDKLNYPRGLIRYSTQNSIDGKRTKILRPRIWIYGLLLLGLIIGWGWGVMHRSPFIAEALRDRNALYQINEAKVENSYTLKITNKTNQSQQYEITLLPNPQQIVLYKTPLVVTVNAQEILSVPVTAHAAEGIKGQHPIEFQVHVVSPDSSQAGSSPSSSSTEIKPQVINSRFFGPM